MALHTPPVVGGFFSLAAMQDCSQRFALLRVGALVDDDLLTALARENRSGPGVNGRGAQAVEFHPAKAPLLAFEGLEAAAAAMGGPAFELAGVAVVAIAVIE
jgi:hypothetical protein